MPEVQEFYGLESFVHPVINVERRMKEASQAVPVFKPCAHVWKLRKQIYATQQVGGELARAAGILLSGPLQNLFQSG